MPSEIGVHAPVVKRAAELLTAKGRAAHGAFLFEGPTLLAEAAASNLDIETIFASERAFAENPQLARIRATELFLANDRILRKLSAVDEPAGIIAVARRPHFDAHSLLAGDGGVALLASLNDPGNVGTLIRSAETFGIAGVLMLDGGADPFGPKVVRAAMGSLFRLPVGMISADALARSIGTRPMIAAARGGVPVREFRFSERALLAIGHERHGLGHDLPQPAHTLEIPHFGRTESLNAAVAGSIIFYEFALSSRCQDLGPASDSVVS